MKDIRPALYGYLLADPAIAAAVGDRIFPVQLPQNEVRQSIVYNRISGQGDHTLQGPVGLARTRFQITCWAPTHNAASILANLVKVWLDGYRGSMESTDSPPDVVEVQGAFFGDERDLYDANSKLYGVSRDYFIWVEER